MNRGKMERRRAGVWRGREGDWLKKRGEQPQRGKGECGGQEASTSLGGSQGGQRGRGWQVRGVGGGQWELIEEPQESCPACLSIWKLRPAREALRRRLLA